MFLAFTTCSIVYILWPKEDSTTIIKEENTSIVINQEYPTNKDQLLSEVGERAYYDKRGGVIFEIPENFELNDYGDYYLLNNINYNAWIVLITNSDNLFNNNLDVLSATEGIKERINYKVQDGILFTSLFDTNYSVTNEKIDIYQTATESNKIYLSHGVEVYSKFYNFALNTIGISVGIVAFEDNLYEANQICHNFIASIKPVVFLDSPTLDPNEFLEYHVESFKDIKINIPNGWSKSELGKGIVFSPPVCIGNPLFGTKIILYLDNNKNNYLTIDNTYKMNEEIYVNLLSQNPLIQNGYTLEVFMDTNQTNNLINGRSYQQALLTINMIPKLTTDYSSYPERSIKALHYMLVLNDNQTLNFIFTGVENISFESVKILAKTVMETVK